MPISNGGSSFNHSQGILNSGGSAWEGYNNGGGFSGGGVSTGGVATTGSPLFVVCSQIAGGGQFVGIKNLQTGALAYVIKPNTNGFTASSSIIVLNGYTGSGFGFGPGNSGGYLAAATVIDGYVGLTQFLAWAAAPQDFWYPPTPIVIGSHHASVTYPVTLTQNLTIHDSFVKIPVTLLQHLTLHPSFGAIQEILLQKFTIHDTPPLLQGPPVMFDRATIQDALHLVTTASAQDGFKVSLSSATQTAYHYNLINRIFLRPTQFPAWNAVIALTQNLTVSLSASQKYIWGRVLRQALRVSDAMGASGHYSVILAQLFKLASAFSRIFPMALSQNVTVSPAQAAALRLRLLQNVLMTLSSSPVFTYHLTVTSQAVIREILSKSLHYILSQLFTIHDAPGRQFISDNSLAQLLTVHPALTNTLVLRIVGNLDVSPSQLVHMIYAGDPLLDGVVITALYISPSGTTTTWAVNTRTNAVTEYMNYNFRSFALLNNRYIAAGAGGLYELEGDTDAGASIIGDLMGGYLQLNEKKLFGIKGAYVAIRGGGRFYLKLIGGDGREYTYELRAQPNLMTTKIKVGKGLSTTYMAWELVTEGQDFDLDSIEFIPMTRGRRV